MARAAACQEHSLYLNRDIRIFAFPAQDRGNVFKMVILKRVVQVGKDHQLGTKFNKSTSAICPERDLGYSGSSMNSQIGGT